MARAGGRAVSRAKADQADPAAPGAGAAARRQDAAAGGEERVREAADAAATVHERSGGLGRPGRAMNRRSPFYIGMTAAAGVAITAGVVELIIRTGSLLILIGLALFIAVGLDPVVSWLTRRGVPRWAAVLAVIVAAMGVAAGFLVLAIPPLTSQAAALVHSMPHYIRELESHNSALGRLNARYHVQQDLTKLLTSKGGTLAGGVLGAGKIVLGAVSSTVIVLVLTIYFLADLPQIKRFGYRLVPNSRRPRAMLITEEILDRIGGYMLGNILTSVIAGAGTFVWMLALGIPYPFLLALLVALLDLIPIIGSTIGGAVVTLVALTVSVPVAAATLGFYIAYRLAEDYLITPRVMNRTVEVPAVVTLVAVLIGGALLGIIGALVAIPLAAAIHLLLNEIAFRRLDKS